VSLLLALTGTEVAGWIVVCLAVAVGLFGFWIITQADKRDDWMGSVRNGLGLIALAIGIGTIGLRMAGQLPPEDPFRP
jgi:hypothetical protein